MSTGLKRKHVLSAARGSGGVFSLVTSLQYAIGGSAGGSTTAIDTTGATLLVVSVAVYAVGYTLSDSKTNTWTPLTLRVSNDGAHQFYYVINPTVGTNHTFTILGTAMYAAMIIHAFKGPFNPTFQIETGKITGSSPLQTGSVTPSKNGALIISGVGANSAVGPTNNAGLIQQTIPTNSGVCVTNGTGYLVQTIAASINPTWTWTGTATIGMSIAVFLPS